MKPKKYIGDGVFAEITEQGLVLTTEDGIETTNRIVLEPDIAANLMVYVGWVFPEQQQKADTPDEAVKKVNDLLAAHWLEGNR